MVSVGLWVSVVVFGVVLGLLLGLWVFVSLCVVFGCLLVVCGVLCVCGRLVVVVGVGVVWCSVLGVGGAGKKNRSTVATVFDIHIKHLTSVHITKRCATLNDTPLYRIPHYKYSFS